MAHTQLFIDAYGNDDAAYAMAINFAGQLADSDPEITTVILLTHTLGNNGWFERILGKGAPKLLRASGGVKVKPHQTPFKHETPSTINPYGGRGERIIIAMGLDSKDLVKVDDYDSVKYLIAVPWNNDGIDDWKTKWQPGELKNGMIVPRTPALATRVSILSPKVIAALDDLTEDINLSTGIHHPSDEMQAKTYLLALHKYEKTPPSPIEIEGYLIRQNGWQASHAKEFADLLRTLQEGRYFKGGERTGLKKVYDRW